MLVSELRKQTALKKIVIFRSDLFIFLELFLLALIQPLPKSLPIHKIYTFQFI